MIDEEMMDKLDAVAQMTLTNIYTLTKDSQFITVKNFNLKNKEDLFFLRVATIAKDIFDKPIFAECGFFTWLWLNWKFRKVCKFRRCLYANPKSIDVHEVLDFMRPALSSFMGDEMTFDVIYELLYEKGKEQYNED